MAVKPVVSIRIEGLKECLESLRRIDADLAREVKRGFKEDAQPILRSARGYARALGGSGAYASSLSIRALKNGVRIQSSDPGAGTIEFAHLGAVYLRGSRKGRRLGVPSGSPPRALVRAVDEHEDEVRQSAEARVARVIERYLNG